MFLVHVHVLAKCENLVHLLNESKVQIVALGSLFNSVEYCK